VTCDARKHASWKEQAAFVGEDVRPVGSDIAAGEVVLDKGELIGAAEIGLLATIGAAEVQVGMCAGTAGQALSHKP
jgi:molybdopterin biosynthesis enzyme